MNNRQHPMNMFSEHNELSIQHVEAETASINIREEQLLLDYLLEGGFVWEEAVKLVYLREHLHENGEMRQRMQDDCRMHFARWLYEHGEMREL